MECLTNVVLGLMTVQAARVAYRMLPYLVPVGWAERLLKRRFPGEGTVLVTGATDGIGKELANYFHRLGYKVIVHGRNESKLNILQQEIPNSIAIKEDLLVSNEQLLKAVQDYKVRIVVNCAGITRLGEFGGHSQQDINGLIKLNVQGMSTLLNKLVRTQTQDRKLFVNICSLTAMNSFPYISLYGATKAFQSSLIQAAQKENPSTLMVNVCPWYVQTKMVAFRKSWDSEPPVEIANNLAKIIVFKRQNSTGSPRHQLLSLFIPVLRPYFESRLRKDHQTLLKMRQRRRGT